MSSDTRELICAALSEALRRAHQDGVLPSVPAPEIRVESPQNREHGDYSCNIALRLASVVRMPPLTVASLIAERIERAAPIAGVEAVRPGFLNFRLDADWKRDRLRDVIKAGDQWGRINIGMGKRVQVEFVSANPTGPVQVGNGRGAVLGDTLANVLDAAGFDVQREYYINNMGRQIDLFGRTLFARYQQAHGRDIEPRADAYPGQYMKEVANDLAREWPRDTQTKQEELRLLTESTKRLVPEVTELDNDRWLDDPEGQPSDDFIARGIGLMIRYIRADLRLLGVEFDHWQPESALYQPSEAGNAVSSYDAAMLLVRDGGFVVEKENAIWFRYDDAGEEKDSVLIRGNGEPTYFASDVAYHYNKFIERSFDIVINVWGSDHHGHVSRTKAAVDAIGGDSERLEVLLYQLVHLRRGGKRVRMSKRTGDIVTLRELIDEVGSTDIPGSDVVRFFFLRSSADAQMDFDLDAVTSQDIRENPLAYIHYAHTRCASVLRSAGDQGLAPADGHLDLLDSEREDALIVAVLRLPELVADVATRREPHHLTTFALELAQSFSRFYDACRIIDSDQPKHSEARLFLTKATQFALAAVLRLIGIVPARSMHNFRASDPSALLHHSSESRGSSS